MAAHGSIPLLALGDSHSAVFEHPKIRAAFPDFTWECVRVPGATASGLENPNDSRTQAYPIFRRALAESAAKRVFVTLGEVDTGFVIWYRSFKYDTDVFHALSRADSAYGVFLDEIAAGGREVVVLSAALPTLGDGAVLGAVANARRLVNIPRRTRTALTLEFNERLHRRCRARGYGFIDLDRDCLDRHGEIRAALLNSDAADHHYEASAYAEILIPRLRPFLSPAFCETALTSLRAGDYGR